MADSGWVWEEDGSIEIQTQPVSLTYCSTLNCIILSNTDHSIDIIDVNSGEIVRRNLLLGKDEENNSDGLYCIFNSTVGNLTVTNGTRIGLRKDLNGIYMLKTILQVPLQETRDEEIVVEMTLPDMEHVVSGLQAGMKNAHEPQLTMMQKVTGKLNESIQKVKSKIYEGDDKLQKWATCYVHVEGDLIHSTLTHVISMLQGSSSKGPQLSSSSALLSQVNGLLPLLGGEQLETVSNKKKMWSEANRRKTFCNWPHKDYKWAVPDTMAQAGFYHQSDRRTYPNSIDRAVCFTCNVGLVCWEPTDEPWSEHERHSPNCPFVRGECTENVPLSVTVATSPAQFHNKGKQKIVCLSPPSSVPLMATSTADGHVVVWDIRDELQVRFRTKLKITDKVLANEMEEIEEPLGPDATGEINEQCSNETLEEASEIGVIGLFEESSVEKGEVSLANGSNGQDDKRESQTDENTNNPEHLRVEVTSLGLLKNIQELESLEETPLIPKILSEAMLIAGINVNNTNVPTRTSEPTTSKKPYLLVCEVPPDKNRARPASKSGKLDDDKSKMKPVSYSTQLSFESEDEFYDPLFSGPIPQDVFQKMSSPTKDAFPQMWGDKIDGEGSMKDARVLQCLNLENSVQSDDFVVSQVLSYDDGSHVLLVLTKRKQTANTALRCSEKDGLLSNTDDVLTEGSMLNDNSEGGLTHELVNSERSSSVTLPYNTSSSYNEEEVVHVSSNESSGVASQGSSNALESNHSCPTDKSLLSVEASQVNDNLIVDDSLSHAVDSTDSSSLTQENSSCHKEDVGSETKDSSRGGQSGNGETLNCSTHNARSSLSVETSGIVSSKQPTTNTESGEIQNPLGGNNLDNAQRSSSSQESLLPEEKTSSSTDADRAVCDDIFSCCLILYKTKKTKGRTLLEDQPCKTMLSSSPLNSFRDLFLLPEDVEETFNPGTIDDSLSKSTYLAGIAADGSLVVMDGLTLELVTRFPSDNDGPVSCFRRVVFCSGLGSFCACTEDGKLHFLHLLKNTSEEEMSSSSSGVKQIPGKEKQPKESTSNIPCGDLALSNLKALVQMTTFENLVPRYTAIAPVFWSEIQQEQQQRRHPQHLLHNSQGDASCHTRTWRLQKKGVVGGDQLFELMLPRPCYVGHVDIKFTLNKSIASKSKVQVILSKPRSSSLRAKPAQAFTTTSSQQIKGDLICGPIDLSENQQPHGVKGHVVLTSAALLRTKVRTLYVIFKTLPSAKSEESPGGRNGFSDLEEISITVRSLTSHFNAELFGAFLESRDFCPKLLDVVCKKINSEVSGQKQKELQWLALELLCWIAGISVHQPVSEESLASLVVKRFPMLIQSCFLSASRSIAHKCSRLIVLCVSQISHCDDGGVAKTSLLKAFLDVLPCTITSESIGGIHWFFTLLTGMLSAADMNSTGKSCMELLMKIAQQLDGKLTYFDRILRANFSLYGTPLDPTVFDVSRETLGLFGTSKLSDDLFNPKNEGKASPEIDEIDLVDYCSRNNGRPLGSTTKMEKFLSSVYGILEVEPLDFCCSSMSDGCKVDLCHNFDQPGVNGGIGSLYYPTATTATTDGIPTTAMSAIQDHVQQLKEHEKLLSKLQKQKQQLEEQHQELEELGGMLFPSTPPQKNMFYDDPWLLGKKMASPQGVPQLKFGTSFGAKPYGLLNTKSQSLNRAVKTKPHHTQQTHTSFQLPVPKLLTIEKFQPGSRHFVVLDFGQNVRLTDVFIPSCPDLSSLVIDIWVDSEEKDLNRVSVSTDIGTKSLLLTDLLPPLACRYLKISLFARHGTQRTKLILGEFFGYPMLSDSSVAEEKTGEESLDASRENYLNLMYDDIFCQYGVACLRLESVLNSLEPGASNGTSSPTNEKLLTDEAKVRQAYTVCMNLQLRLNFLEQSIRRIHRRQTQDPQPILPNDVDDTASVIEHASYSKLKVISDWLVHVLVSLFGVDEPADNPGSSQQVHWFQEITLDTCQSLFTIFCVKGTSVSRARVGAVLLRACGEQTWWGSFLAWVMEEFFRVDQTLMFSRERLFLLLTSMSQLSIPQYSVVTSALDLLEKLLSPLLGDVKQDSGQRSFDSSLLEWVTLYVSNLLDNFMDTSRDVLSNPKGDENDDAQPKMTADQQSTTRRWDFIVPRAANDSLKDSLKDLKGSRKEMRKIKKQISIRQRRLQVLHQQHLINKAQFFEEYGSSSMMNPPSPFQITQWNKQFRQKAKKPLKDLLRLKRLIADSSPQPVSENPCPRRCKKLPRHLCLPVMKGLLAVLLSRQGACKVDFFVLICKVLGCLTLVSHPRVRLFDLATSAQLEQLLRMCVRAEGVPTSNWSPGDQWIKHACTSLLQDLIIELRPYTVDEVTSKAKEETGESANGSTEVTNDADSDTSFSDIQESEEPSDEAIAELTNFNEWFHDQSFVSEIAEMKLTSKKKESSLVYSAITLTPTLNAAEISTAEDCRLEISVEMKAERELRRLAFTSRQRFLTGMDVKSKIGNAMARSTGVGSTGVGSTGSRSTGVGSTGVGSTGVGSSGVGSTGSRSTGVGSTGVGSTGSGSTEVESTGVGSSRVGSSGVESAGVESNGNGSPEQFVFIDASEQSFEGCSKVCHFFSQCIGKLVVDSFNGPYDTDSVLELCLTLNDDPTNHPLFLVTQQAMEASLVGLSTVEGASARSWNIAISWLRTLLQQSPYAFSFQPTEGTHSPYATAEMIVENPRFGRVIGRMLTTYNYGDSGKKALGPSAGENLSSLLKELVDLTALQQRGISTSTLQELLLDILLFITAHNDDETRLLSARRQPLDVCIGFLEFFTRSFPVGPPLHGLLKPVHIVDSILSVVLLHLSSSHQVHCSANSSKKRYNSLFESQGLPRERSREPSDAKFAILCLKVLGKLLPLGGSAELSFINSLADCLVCEGATMGKLLACLNLCRGESFELVEIGLNILSSDLSTLNGLDNPTSVEDGVMKAFCLLHKHTKHREALIRAMLDFFSKDTALKGVNSTPGSCHLSELLLWVLLKLLDSDDIFQIFYENGGIDIICSKLSQATLRALHPVRGIVSTVVHQLGVKTQTKTESEKPLLAAAWESDKNLVNFAPFASIHCSQESSNLADPLITMSVSPRRARTAAWSYHFNSDESWCTLVITLPNTIIVHEVVIQPHTTSLLNSTSYVTMELGQEGSPVSNISPPLLTAGLSNIRLQLTTPELASVVRLRFHRPRDSDTLGLTRIEVLGTSFYGPTPQVQPILQSQKASLNWSRALDYCLRRSHIVSSSVLKTLSETVEILDVLLKILWSFRSSNFKPCVEFILIKLASYSSPLSTQLLTQLLYGGGLSDQPDGCLTGSLGVSASDNSENELLYQLGILQDDQAWSRLKIMCEWLLHVEDEINLDTGQKRLMAGSNLIPKIRTITAIIWFSKDHSNQCDHLQDVITEERFRRIYHWCQSSTDIPMLKLTLEHLICALCYVNRSFYQCLLTLSGPSLGGGLLDFCALTTLARASISAQGAADLLESNVLQSIVGKVEKSCRKFTRRSKKVSSSAKLGQTSSETSELALEELRGMVEFLITCLDHFVLKDWLGSEEGNSFWHSLLTFLADCQPRMSTRHSSRDTASCHVPICPRLLTNLQTTVLRFFKKCVSGHVGNQRYLARVLHEVLAREADDTMQGMKTLSGFVRRLVLELLLDEDHVILAITCEGGMSQGVVTSSGSASQSPLWHPRFGASNSCRLFRVRVNTTILELINLLVTNPLPRVPKVASGTNDSARKTSETLQDLMELLELGDLSKNEAMTLASSAMNVKNKRSNHGDKKPGDVNTKGDSKDLQQETVLPSENCMFCMDGPLANLPLPKETTIGEIMETLIRHGQGMGTISVQLGLRSPAEHSGPISVMTSLKPVSTLLEVFSKLGGLALIADHLSPRFSVQGTFLSPVYSPVVMSSAVPGHSLMGFTMFLRLPGYADIFLESQRNARFMLRLILGVEDDGEGGYIPALPSSRDLPTLPFNILEKMFKLNPVATPTGACIRQTALDIGVVHLLLTCLGLLSHHKPRDVDSRHEATMEALKVFNASGDPRRSQSAGGTNSKQYWAKGTGFGTGSTSSGWDIEQALVKQKNEEEHITWILQVLASFICPVGVNISAETNIDEISLNVSDEDITNVLPSLPEILMNSCLIPTLASYLRNDSVLDMARHVPLYRAVLGFVRCIAVSPNLVPLLQPARYKATVDSSNGDTSSLCSLLTKMKLCVDTYGNRLKSSEKAKETKPGKKASSSSSSSSIPTTKTEDVENESLSLLIPDVQTTSMLVHKAVDHYRWLHLKTDGSNTDLDGQGVGTGEEQMSIEERYSSVMMPLQFDTFAIVSEGTDGKLNFTLPFHYSTSVKSATSSGQRTNSGRARRLAQEIASLSTSLPLSYSSSVFVRCDEERLDLMKVLITGPADTPYANGCFEFDVYFPPDYPSSPMHISFETTGNHRIRFNPNLYNDGKVCLSILNTWHGRPEEKWNSQTSSFLQVLVSIQSLILVPEPYFNEPGYERSRGTHSGTVNSREYDANIRQATVKWAMLEPVKKPCPCFKEVIERHFYLKQDEVLQQCDEWIRELEAWSKEKRTMRSITHHLESLRRHTTQLREAISKIPQDCLQTAEEDTE